MPRLDRRLLLGSLLSVASFPFAGCASLLEDGESEGTVMTQSISTPGPSTTTTDEGAIGTPVDSSIETKCITSEFSGYIGTTPIPAPARPEKLNPRSAIDYAITYERYYERYLALYEMGSPTPEEEGHPAHGFPEVRLEALESELLAEGDDRYVVRLAFSRFFEDTDRGEYTVTYYVSEEDTIRAEVDGIEHPGPDPLAAGKFMSC